MTNVVTLQTNPQRSTARQRRLRAVVKRLVIELGYLEQCLAEDVPNVSVQKAAKKLDSAIDCLNEHLVRGRG